jgi:hypothetical protein
MKYQTLADIFEEIHKQATILTGGNLSLLTTSEFIPNWRPSQVDTKGQCRNDHRILAHDTCVVWLTAIQVIKSAYPKEPQPVPNYLEKCGGSAAVQRLMDSSTTFLCGKAIYHPSHLLSPKFSLTNLCRGCRCALNAVIIETIVFSWLEPTLTIVFFIGCLHFRRS